MFSALCLGELTEDEGALFPISVAWVRYTLLEDSFLFFVARTVVGNVVSEDVFPVFIGHRDLVLHIPLITCVCHHGLVHLS